MRLAPEWTGPALRALRIRPYVLVSQFGQRTNRPKVSVGIVSRNGMTSISVFADDDQGNGAATMRACGLSHILGMPVFDQREKQELKMPTKEERGWQIIFDEFRPKRPWLYYSVMYAYLWPIAHTASLIHPVVTIIATVAASFAFIGLTQFDGFCKPKI